MAVVRSFARAVINLGPMNRGELAAAIKQPAEKVGLSLESGLLERILDDALHEPGNLPLLEFVLKQLPDNRSHGQLLHAAYEAIGRCRGRLQTKQMKFSPNSRHLSNKPSSAPSCNSPRLQKRVTTLVGVQALLRSVQRRCRY